VVPVLIGLANLALWSELRHEKREIDGLLTLLRHQIEEFLMIQLSQTHKSVESDLRGFCHLPSDIRFERFLFLKAGDHVDHVIYGGHTRGVSGQLM